MENLKSKEDLRKEAAKQLLALSDERKEQASRDALSHLSNRFLSYVSILSYAPLSDELDIGTFNKLLSNNKRLLLPKVDENDLLIYRCDSIDTLQPSYLGMKEPSSLSSDLVDPSDLSIALIPARAFSKEKDRLGRGKGYYDRFLKKHPHIYKIGIGYKEQLISEPFAHSHDHKMDELLLF